jgi:hypothetical protein
MLRYFPPERRRRLAPLFLVIGLAFVGKLAHDEMPRDQELTFVLPSSNVQSLRVTYTAGDEFFGGFERRFPQGAPSLVSHTPSLSPGRYQVAVALTDLDGGVTRLDRSIDVPLEGVLRVPLSQGH